jgi:hypothetical protein
VLIGRNLTTSERASVQTAIADGKWGRPVTGNTAIAFKYYTSVDEIRVRDTEFESTQESTSPDIGQTAAYSQMVSTLAQLNARGLVLSSDYSPSMAKVGTTTGEKGTVSPPSYTSWVDEYRFMMMMRLNSINVVNNFVHIGIKRGGGVASLRLGGVEINRTGVSRARTVSDAAIASTFTSDTSGASQVNVFRNELMYVTLEGVGPTIVEPARLYNYSLSYGGSVSRRKNVGYSLTQAGARTDYQPPVDNGPSDTR